MINPLFNLAFPVILSTMTISLFIMFTSRLLTKSADTVIEALKGSIYSSEHDLPLRWLRPYWTTILSGLRRIQYWSVMA